jgi:hypothetical protein
MVSLMFIPLSTVMGAVSKHWGICAVLIGVAIWLVAAKIMIELMVARRSRSAPEEIAAVPAVNDAAA